MTDLFKQLEDKKKELTGWEEDSYFPERTKELNIIIRKKEIAILEQAIAEMQKQRQENLDKIEETYKDFLTSQTDKDTISVQNIRVFKNRIEQQLNQPKTEE